MNTFNITNMFPVMYNFVTNLLCWELLTATDYSVFFMIHYFGLKSTAEGKSSNCWL